MQLLPTAIAMFLFGHLSGMAVLNGYIQTRSGLTLPQFGLVLSTGAITALLVNLYLKLSGKKISGATGLILLAFAVWLPVLAQGLPALLLAYSMQGAASRIALSGLYRAITSIQRQSMGMSFFLNALLTQYTGQAIYAAGFALSIGIPAGLWLRGKLPDWTAEAARQAATQTARTSVPLAVAFTAYCAEVFTMTQATAWSSVLAKTIRIGDTLLPPLVAAGILSGVFWMVVGSVRYLAGLKETMDLRRIVLAGNVLCVVAIVGAILTPASAGPLMLFYALLGAGIACFVPFALQIISMHPKAGEMADYMAMLGPVMSVSVHLITGNFAEYHNVFVLGALTLSLLAALKSLRT
ncbi:MAG: hypothetical protein NTW74_22980 [Acidobacteria bacterium]|nr:hypothetical protein [Acidobacteriota bacterium]